MPAISVNPGIYWIGVNDRTTDLFEGVWPIEQTGVSYNSYLVIDEKKALIDLAKSTQSESFLDQIGDLMNPAELDYIIVNHMEPDHTGVIKTLRYLAPNAQIVGTARTRGMLESYYGITENVRTVEDGEDLSLGEKTLRFYSIPFVHWPETMATYEVTRRVLFSCDAFGGYGALRGAIFDDQYADMDFYIQEALRYYVNIIARFSGPVLKAIAKLDGVPIDVVAPSHGLVWRNDPGKIVQLYKTWAEYATHPAEAGITLIYGSMYGHTEQMMNAVAEGISNAGVPLRIFDAARTHSSYILPHVWTNNGVMVGAPTYEVSLFPPVAQALSMIVNKRIVNRKAAYFGSYGWSGGARRECESITESLKWEWVEPFEFQGAPTRDDLHKGEEYGRRFAEMIAKG
ncbi:MAG TPA: FprA family A-type flavoprotein [Chloroflexi bacterium]|jgi:anaerobic nitric oxide reductase flavorubredoxin|nr:FprA family A-type flavoprotein [Chloroflexota bacterium]